MKNLALAHRQIPTEPHIDVTPVCGKWLNVKPHTLNVSIVEIRLEDDRLLLRLFGSGDLENVDWGEVEAFPTAGLGSQAAVGLWATLEHEDMKSRIAANTKLGVFVLQVYTQFHDGSGRRSYFSREFFRRQEEKA